MPLSSAVSLALLGVTGLHALNAPVPFLPRPYYLTGELAADAGFDPAGLVLSPLLGNPAALADPTKVIAPTACARSHARVHAFVCARV